MHMVVEVGMPYCEAKMTLHELSARVEAKVARRGQTYVMAEPSSMQKPREGDMSVMRLPSIAMVW